MTRKIIYIVLGLVVVLSAAFFYWSLQPSYTVAKAAYSIVAKNRRSFDRAVELNRVADGLADDSVAQALKNMGADPMGDAGLVQSALALKMVEALKPQLVSFVHKTVDSYFSSEPVVNSSGQSLNSVLLMLLSSRSDLKFDWKVTTEQNPEFAMVTIGFKNMRTSQPLVLRFRLEPQNKTWRIVRVYNLVESLSEQK